MKVEAIKVGETAWSSGDETIKEGCGLFFGWKDAFPKAERDQWRVYPGMIVEQYFKRIQETKESNKHLFPHQAKIRSRTVRLNCVFFLFSQVHHAF